MALKDLNLIAHYAFDGGMQDSSSYGNDLTSTYNEDHTYVPNMSDFPNSAIIGNTNSSGRTLVSSGSSLANYSLQDFNNGSSVIFSFWVKSSDRGPSSRIYFTGNMNIQVGNDIVSGGTHTSVNFNSGNVLIQSVAILHNAWNHYVLFLTKHGDGVLRYSVSLNGTISGSHTHPAGSFGGDIYIENLRLSHTIDEIRYYKGDVNTGEIFVGEAAQNDLLEPYYLSVDNLGSPSIIDVEDVTTARATVRWEV